MELTRPLAIAADGADAVADDGDVVTLSPAAWERFNAGAVWCSLDGLRFAVNRPYAVLEVTPPGGSCERVVVPATMATSWFWSVCGLHSSRPFAPPDVDRARCLETVERGEGLHLRIGRGDEVLRHDHLIQHPGGWLRGRRLEDQVTIDDFDMRDLVLDLSTLLAENLLDD